MNRPSNSRPLPPLPTRRHALFVDFDGTLVDTADHPGDILVPELLRGMLMGLSRRFGGALAVVTGRRLESLDETLAPMKLAGAGLHGAQLRLSPDGLITESRALTDVAARLEQRFEREDGIWIEDKGAVVAVHWRKVPERAAFIRAELGPVAAQQRLDLLEGNGVFELLQRGHGKDMAVRNLMRSEPFRNRLPVFVGDSASDEAGIREAQTLGGLGIKVGPGSTEAGWRLDNPSAVIDWLRETLWSLPDD